MISGRWLVGLGLERGRFLLDRIPTESARRRALSSIISVMASTLIDGIWVREQVGIGLGGARRGLRRRAQHAWHLGGGPSSVFGVDAGGAAAEGCFVDGTIWLATPGLTTLAGGPAGAPRASRAACRSSAATSGALFAAGAAAPVDDDAFDES